MTEWEKAVEACAAAGAHESESSAPHNNCSAIKASTAPAWTKLCAVAEVSKRTLYQHFTGKDELIAECLRRFDPDILPEVFDRTDLTPRERLLAAFDIHSPLCPFIAAAVEIPDPGHPARFTPATTRKPLPPGSPTPPARLAPPTPNSSANNWRCCWMAPRPAAESSTPRPSPPPPPSRPSSSKTPSPRERYRPAQAPSSSTARSTMTPARARPAFRRWRRYRAPWRGPHPRPHPGADVIGKQRSQRRLAPAMMRHGTDESCVPDHRAMNGHVATLVGCSSCEARQRDPFFLDVGPSQLPRFEHRLGT